MKVNRKILTNTANFLNIQEKQNNKALLSYILRHFNISTYECTDLFQLYFLKLPQFHHF